MLPSDIKISKELTRVKKKKKGRFYFIRIKESVYLLFIDRILLIGDLKILKFMHSHGKKLLNVLLFLKFRLDEIVSWPTVVVGDPKAAFLIAITPKFSRGCYSFLWIASLTLDQYVIMLIVKQRGIQYHFLSQADL